LSKPKQEEEKLFLPDPEPERIVVVVRAVCGALAGLFVAGVNWLKFFEELGRAPTILLFLSLSVAFSYWATRYGDVFWERWRRNPFWG